MAIYDPRQKRGPNAPVQPGGPINMPSSSGVIAGAGGGPPNLVDIMKTLPLALASFVASLPAVEGPSPDVDYVLSVCLQSNIPPLPGRPLQASSAPEHAPKLNPNRGDRRSGSRQTRQR